MPSSFNGTSDRIDFTSLYTPGELTLSVWIKPTNITQRGYIFHVHNNTGNLGFLVQINGAGTAGTTGIVGICSGTNLQREEDAALSAGVWQHIAVTWDGNLDSSGLHYYLDGVELDYTRDDPGTGTLGTYSGSWSFGGRIPDDNRNYNGYLANGGVWDVQLPLPAIMQLAKGANPYGYRANLIRCIPFFGSTSTEMDLINTDTGTLDGTSYIGDYPPARKFAPFRPIPVPVAIAPAAPAAAGAIMTANRGYW